MDASFDRTDEWDSWATELYAADFMSDYTIYVENSALGTSAAFTEFDGNWATDATHNPRDANSSRGGYDRQSLQHTSRNEHSASKSISSTQNPQPDMVTTIFPDVTMLQRSDPPQAHDVKRQKPRWEGDFYTALWIRGEGVQRAGWCGYCSVWYKLKDSAFNYHMHYTHGISATGKPVDRPQAIRCLSTSLQVLCGGCGEWIGVGNGNENRAKTYFRHAHKCHASANRRTVDASSHA